MPCLTVVGCDELREIKCLSVITSEFLTEQLIVVYVSEE